MPIVSPEGPCNMPEAEAEEPMVQLPGAEFTAEETAALLTDLPARQTAAGAEAEAAMALTAAVQVVPVSLLSVIQQAVQTQPILPIHLPAAVHLLLQHRDMLKFLPSVAAEGGADP